MSVPICGECEDPDIAAPPTWPIGAVHFAIAPYELRSSGLRLLQAPNAFATLDFATAASGLRLLEWRQRWAPRIPVLRERPEKRQQSCQFGVHLGNVGLILRLQR